MKILVEGQRYRTDILNKIFDDSKFFIQEGEISTINSVGYYHSFVKGELVYMLPKVFMIDEENTVFGLTKDELLFFEKEETFKHKSKYYWIRQISVYFYQSLIEFKRRKIHSNLLQNSFHLEIDSSLGEKEYSYLDLVLTFANFYKKNRNLIFFKDHSFKSHKNRRINWEKTVLSSTPFFSKNNQPIYTFYRGKKKVINEEEKVVVYFLSILNYFNDQHNLTLNFDKKHRLITGLQFEVLQRNGLKHLRKIKYKYFNDKLKRIYNLCELYFSLTDKGRLKRKRDEFLSITNYNLVFEDMIDKIFSDPILNESKGEGLTLRNLKYNEDGKIIDHIFEYQSIIDLSNIFYIGDSKYYKPYRNTNRTSNYKQFTYAKNVIQYNIDLLNENGRYYSDNIRYRDNLTEGYNITPNFFIYGYIDDYKNFLTSEIEEKGEIQKSFHFEDRLFDRDTLFVHQYKINFLYVLWVYAGNHRSILLEFREEVKDLFRNNFILFFTSGKSGFRLFEYKKQDFELFIEKNFKRVNGKIYLTQDRKLLLAVYKTDNSLNDLIKDFKDYSFI